MRLLHERDPIENPAGDRREHHVDRGDASERDVDAAVRPRQRRIGKFAKCEDDRRSAKGSPSSPRRRGGRKGRDGRGWRLPPSWPAARSSQPCSRISISNRITTVSRITPSVTCVHLCKLIPAPILDLINAPRQHDHDGEHREAQHVENQRRARAQKTVDAGEARLTHSEDDRQSQCRVKCQVGLERFSSISLSKSFHRAVTASEVAVGDYGLSTYSSLIFEGTRYGFHRSVQTYRQMLRRI